MKRHGKSVFLKNSGDGLIEVIDCKSVWNSSDYDKRFMNLLRD